ncbi:hypothetical protein BCR44DRAFT_1434260 [Catenaria anguillulae PL171]|uniref:Ankyrin repeat-containing domain protein n=1 Tax=Catenaria anguillulae PL171 TaxID=765915 RepID=A0A1Y2HNA5_9FUNG|nr:hypothetical protein BCR44DRAFT_1434260 [Catenaria anguillulae PL171]
MHMHETVARYNELPMLNCNGALVLAVQAKLYHWIDLLGISPAVVEYWPASSAACKAGDVDVLAWMQTKGYLVGSRHQLLDCATHSGQVQVLDWIHAHIDSTVADCTNRPFWPECDPYLGACMSASVDVLNWLQKNTDIVLQYSHLSNYFKSASGGNIKVLDWLMQHVDFTWIHEDLCQIALKLALPTATRNACLPVLKWWRKTLVGRELIDSEMPGEGIPTNMFDSACRTGDLEIVNWWFKDSDPLIKYYTTRDLGLEVCKGWWASETDPAEILEVLYRHDEIDDIEYCIHVASLTGNLRALEWFLPNSSTSHDMASFMEALTRANHGASLLWWKAKVLREIGEVSQPSVTINHEYKNPIHAHIIKSMRISAQLQHPVEACRDGNLSMLMYYQSEDRRYFQKLSEEEVETCLMHASMGDHVHVLQWWRTKSGVKITSCVCASLRSQGSPAAQRWWATSGLCSHL